MPNLVPYINFMNKSQKAIKFYKSIFGGDASIQLEGECVIHLDFQADGIHFMGSDHKSNEIELKSSNGYGLVLNCDNEEQLRDFYAKLVKGGREVFVPVDSGWGAIVAHCIDQFGISWMLNYDKT